MSVSWSSSPDTGAATGTPRRDKLDLCPGGERPPHAANHAAMCDLDFPASSSIWAAWSQLTK
jgi:hypothetical protein